MTVHRDKLLVNKTKRRTEFQFYWCYHSTCFGQPFCPSSGVLCAQERDVPSCSWVQTVINLHKMYQSRCTAKNSWWWAERLSETCRVVIPIKLEFSASVGFIHKESVTMHDHTIVKFHAHYLSHYFRLIFCYSILRCYLIRGMYSVVK